MFGELALLYNCKRTATVTTKTNVSLWALEREIFQHIVRSAGEERDKERLNLLSKVKDLKSLPDEKLRKIVDCLEEEEYEDNECILRQVQFEMTNALWRHRKRHIVALLTTLQFQTLNRALRVIYFISSDLVPSVSPKIMRIFIMEIW